MSHMISTNVFEDEEAYLLAMQLATASVLPMVLKSAIELELLETIAKAGPPATYLTSSELATKLSVSNPDAPLVLERLLRVLATYSVLGCKLNVRPNGDVQMSYCLTPVCKFLTKNEDGASLAPFLLLSQDRILLESWHHLTDAVREGGIAFNKAHGMSLYDYGGRDPRFNVLFKQSMTGLSNISMKRILETYNGFESLTSLVDVGGGTGASLNMIISKYPTIKGINFDLPHVVRDAPSYNGVEHVGGDMFASVPKGDAIFLKYVFHNWSDEQCLKILENCYEALEENKKVIMAEFILPEVPAGDADNATKSVFHLDATMLQLTSGGKERSEKEFKALATKAGFKSFNKVCCACNIWVMELSK